MGNNSKQDQGETTRMTDYERSKMLRVQENQERLKELGIKKIANSLTSLVDSQKTKKTRKKSAAISETNARYSHDHNGETREDYREEVAASVESPKKQLRTRYIAPLSMNKFANLTKHRIVAPNVSRVLPSEEGCDGPETIANFNASKKSRLQQCKEANERNERCINGSAANENQSRAKVTMGELVLNKKGSQRHSGQNAAKPNSTTTSISHVLPSEEGCDGLETFANSNAAKKSRLQRCKEASERNEQFIDRSEANKNQSRAKVTMGELVLNKKRSQRHSGQNAAKPNSTTRSISSVSRKQLFLIDEEDEDDVRSQDVSEKEMEGVSSEDDENEDLEDDFQSHDINDADRENYGVEDEENENIEHLFDNSDNEIQDDGSEDDSENEDVELELLQVPQSQTGTAISTTKKRGPTMMHNIHTRNSREVIICNKLGQPIGPVTEEKDVVGKFSRFLGTIARTYSYAPLIYNSWRKVPNKDRMWEYVLEKYIVPGDAKSWVLSTIGSCWRGHKSRLKKKHFYGMKDNSTRLNNRPKCNPEKDFLQLLRLWNKTTEQKRCLIAKARRMSQKNMHTAGPKSFARICEDMTNEDPNKEPPSLTKLFERTRERKEGHVYADTYDETERLIEQMKNYQPPEEDGSGQDVSGPTDPFLAVMNKEYNGHRRLFGKGVTNKLLKKVNGGKTSYMVPTELMDSVKTAIDAEMKRLVEMRKQIEDDHERKKLELAEEHKKNKAELEEMRKEIDDQRDKLVEDAVQMLIEKLPPGVKKLLA